MTKHEKMNALVEASGGKWHECTDTCLDFCPEERDNPNPDSVDDLLVIADKLNLAFSLSHGDYPQFICTVRKKDTWDWFDYVVADTAAKALLEALWLAIGGKK